MKIFGMKFASALATCLVGLAVLGHPGRLLAQGTAGIHGHVVNPAGQLITGEVRLTTDRNPTSTSRKFDYAFPIDASGNYKGTDVKPGNYLAVVYQGAISMDFMAAPLAAGDDKTVDFDMTRKEYIDKMSPADREALEEFKKKNAETVATNAKIENLNAMLKQAQADYKAGNYDSAVKLMTDATTAKPDEAILWETLGDSQLGQADVAAKAAKAAKATDASLPDKYGAAISSYQKALSLNAAAAKPNPAVTGPAENQLGQALGKLALNAQQPDKLKDASAAYEAAAKADPPKAGMYYFNEAATLFNGGAGDDAAAAADKAIAADPTKADAYYIKGQALVAKVTMDDKTKKYILPPGCLEAYQKYLELVPTGGHSDEVKGILQSLNEPIATSFKSGKK